MICKRCNTADCYGPDSKACSDRIIVDLKARILELEDLGVTQGFWGRACARLLTKNAAMTRELLALRRKAEDTHMEYITFQLKMVERFNVRFHIGAMNISAVEAVSTAMDRLIVLGNDLRHAENSQERYDAENAWDNNLMGYHDEVHTKRRRTGTIASPTQSKKHQ